MTPNPDNGPKDQYPTYVWGVQGFCCGGWLGSYRVQPGSSCTSAVDVHHKPNTPRTQKLENQIMTSTPHLDLQNTDTHGVVLNIVAGTARSNGHFSGTKSKTQMSKFRPVSYPELKM